MTQTQTDFKPPMRDSVRNDDSARPAFPQGDELKTSVDDFLEYRKTARPALLEWLRARLGRVQTDTPEETRELARTVAETEIGRKLTNHEYLALNSASRDFFFARKARLTTEAAEAASRAGAANAANTRRGRRHG